ncbi:hypothetical protein PALS1_098 [Staphylococcus phage PALS_1]|nr:hypothetical protein PALS1_098 [Staphylococcus phage PALS_1]
MYLNDYVGKFIKDGGYTGYQSTDLVSDYVRKLTLNKYKTRFNANKMKYERLPSSWKLIKAKELLKTDDYREGDIFVSERISVFGFNGIIVHNHNFNNVTVITQNEDGKATNPVGKHLYSKKNIDYIIRPSERDYKEHFKQSDTKVTLSKQEYNKLLDAYNKMKEVFK